MGDRVSVKPKILELNDTNDIYMTMNIAILSNEVNYNGAEFTDDFIEGVIENKEDYVGIPFLVNKDKLENGEYDSLTHELNTETGKLETDQIGSFVDFWEEEIDGAKCLMGSIRIFKRFPETCEAIIELYEDGELETSCEVIVRKYEEVSEDGTRTIPYNEGKNALIGSACVTHGAEKRAKPTLLIAEAYKQDTMEQRGEKKLPQEQKDKILAFNKNVEIKYHGKLETNSLKWHEVGDKIYNLVNPVDAENGGRDYNYFIRDLYVSHVIFEDWDDYEVLYKANYTIEGENVILDAKEDWIKGSYGFIPDGVEVNSLTSQIDQLKQELSQTKEEVKEMAEKKNTEVEANEEKVEKLESKIKKLDKEIEELNQVIVSEKEAKTKLEDTIEELNEQIEDLKVYKENFEKAKKEAKVSELSDRFVKLLDKETFESTEVQEAINELDESKLNAIVVAEISNQSKEDETDEEEIVTSATENKDLIEQDMRDYLFSSREEVK